jgi:hypothetical protein
MAWHLLTAGAGNTSVPAAPPGEHTKSARRRTLLVASCPLEVARLPPGVAAEGSADWSGPVTSLGNNLIGDPIGNINFPDPVLPVRLCTITVHGNHPCETGHGTR